MKKKILVFIGGSYVSGLEVVTLHLVKELVDKGYEVRCVISGWNDGNFKQKLTALNVTYYELKLGWIYIRKPLWTIDSLIHYPTAFFRAKRIVKDFEPDICHFCNFAMLLLLYPLIKSKAIYNLQETHQPGLKHRIIYKLLNKKIHYFTAVSKHIVQVLEKLAIPSYKIKLIYNGIPPVEAKSIVTKSHEPVLVFAIIGQVAEWKGHDNLLKAVILLVHKGITTFKVQIFGNDQTAYGKQLKQRIQQSGVAEYFEWKGFVNNQDEVYNDCSIVIVPSLSGEPCSLTIIESMWREKGLIVSDRGGNPELVEQEQTGLVFQADNAEMLYDCMLKLLQERDYINTLATNARNKAVNNYTSEGMAIRYIKVYTS